MEGTKNAKHARWLPLVYSMIYMLVRPSLTWLRQRVPPLLSTNPRLEDYLTVLALPLTHRPLFPGFYMPLYVKDPKLLAALLENQKCQAPYRGAFLLKDEPGSDTSATETEKSVHDIKGKELYNRLHEVSTLAQITSIQGDQVILIGHRRIRTTEMVIRKDREVSEDPLTVKVDHLKDNPYDKDDDVIKATSFEVISTLRDVRFGEIMFKHILSILEILVFQG